MTQGRYKSRGNFRRLCFVCFQGGEYLDYNIILFIFYLHMSSFTVVYHLHYSRYFFLFRPILPLHHGYTLPPRLNFMLSGLSRVTLSSRTRFCTYTRELGSVQTSLFSPLLVGSVSFLLTPQGGRTLHVRITQGPCCFSGHTGVTPLSPSCVFLSSSLSVGPSPVQHIPEHLPVKFRCHSLFRYLRV